MNKTNISWLPNNQIVYIINPNYNLILFLSCFLLAIPYFGVNEWLINKLNIEYDDSEPFNKRIFKRIFLDMFFIGSVFFLNLGFLLYNILV